MLPKPHRQKRSLRVRSKVSGDSDPKPKTSSRTSRPKPKPRVTYNCKLCKKTLDTKRQSALHIFSSGHIKNLAASRVRPHPSPKHCPMQDIALNTACLEEILTAWIYGTPFCMQNSIRYCSTLRVTMVELSNREADFSGSNPHERQVVKTKDEGTLAPFKI